MFWLLLLAGGWGMVGAVRAIVNPIGIVSLALAIIAGYVVSLFVFIDNKAGIMTSIIDSWQVLSGVKVPGSNIPGGRDELFATCAKGTNMTGGDYLVSFIGIVIGLLFAVVALVSAFASVIAVPVGVISVGICSIIAVAQRDKAPLLFGALVLAGGISTVFLTGISLRIMGATTGMC